MVRNKAPTTGATLEVFVALRRGLSIDSTVKHSPQIDTIVILAPSIHGEQLSNTKSLTTLVTTTMRTA